MATITPRINITPHKALRDALEKAAERDGVTLSAKAASLLELALLIEEDLVLVDITTKRAETSRKTYVSHEQAWK